MLSKPSKHLILTYGPSRTGKSSFINTIMKAEVTPVGSFNNESTTISVNSFEAILSSLPRNPTSLTIFDVPGKYDSKMRMTNTEIKRKIEETVLSISDTDRLSAILVFEALPNQPTQLRSTLMDLEFMLGPEYRRSTIVVLTKADKISDPEELDGAKRTAEGICQENNVPFIYLRNNHRGFTLNDAQYNEQFDSLMDKINLLPPYLLREVQHYQRKINERAKQLELTLEKNKKTVQIEYETQELESKIVPVQKSKVVFDIEKERCGGIAGWLGFTESTIKSRTEYYTENETRYHTETVTKTMDTEMELEYDVSYYLDMAKKEVLQEIRNQYRRN